MGISTSIEMTQRTPALAGSWTEFKLTAIWVDLLRHEAVGIHDDFFELGGNSLLAVNLFARIESQLGAKLPVTAIIEAPTISQLRVFWRPEDSRSHCDTPQGGDGLLCSWFTTLTARPCPTAASPCISDPGQTVYGLQPRSRSQPPEPGHAYRGDGEPSRFAISAEAATPGALPAGRTLRGGHIAFEIARQLQHEGDEVAMVALLDAADVTAKEKPLPIRPPAAEEFRFDD